MVFNSQLVFLRYLNSIKKLGFGSQGITFYDAKKDKVIKVFHDFLDDDDEYSINYQIEDVLKFGKFSNDTYIFPEEVLMVEGKIVGYISKFVPGKCLYETNPLSIDIDEFTNAVEIADKDTKVLAKNGIGTYDVLYNTMYGDKKIHIIDTDEYSNSVLPEVELIKNNAYNFNMSIMYFLVENHFNEIVNNHKILNEMYETFDVNILEFLKLFRKVLSENVGYEINNLGQATACFNGQKDKEKYIRVI